MLDLLQHLINLDWRCRGAALRRIPLLGSSVFYADLPARPAPARASARAAREGARARPAPTLLLIHGLGASSTSFYPIVQQLRRRYRVIVPDLPGCGLSRPPAGRTFVRFAELVDASEKLLAKVAPRGAYVAGNSMGGWIAVKLAARRPDLVRGLGLLNPGGPALRPRDWTDFVRIIAAEERGAVDEWLSCMFHRPPLAMRLVKRELRRIMRGPSVAELMKAITFDDFLSDEEVASVRCPSMLVWGEQDRLLPPGCRSYYLKQLPNVQYEPITACGHCPQLERPKETAERLLRLASADGRRAPAAAPRRRRAARAVGRPLKSTAG
jgi:pimeloyl-ACP methyl ester carboxylesterase